ncbi:VWA domain-containing protein [Aquimarina sp. W85]|uniref:VWA domain-containing protein n=1 Tax=Aquimarina rhodophyticola TaxID=3342246 RepID=UPI00366D8C9E
MLLAMQTNTILLIVFAFLVAIFIAVFQYIYKSKQRTRLDVFFAFLRFISVFSILLLLINPTFKNYTFYTEPPSLLVAVDNSLSIQNIGYQKKAEEFIRKIQDNAQLNERFDITYFNFSDGLQDSVSLDFTASQTNIDKTLTELNQIYRNVNAPIILLTDGNQTVGNAYHFANTRYKQQVFPVMLGDSSKVADLRIKQLNVNRYAYFENDFPVEVLITYTGDLSITTQLDIKEGNRILSSKNLQFDKQNKSVKIQVELPADKIGVTTYTATLSPLENEKNSINNQQVFAVEVIDQKTNILLISDIIHPDLGAIKKSVESNERSRLTIKKPDQVIDIDNYAMVILYQPNSKFANIYKTLKEKNSNRFTITGLHTDWNFLNKIQANYKHDVTRQTEYFLPQFSSNYKSFLTDDIGFNSFPPLQGRFGELTITNKFDILLYKQISSITTTSPLLATIEYQNIKEAILLGEGFWQWRMHNYKEENSFKAFDDFFSKILQYLSSNQKRRRLITLAESFYYSNAQIIIGAEYFTKNYEFDARAIVEIKLKNNENGEEFVLPMILVKNSYQVDLSNLQPGTYEYTVSVQGENLKASGVFKILQYDVEKQFLNADFPKLQVLAQHTQGTIYSVDQSELLQSNFVNDQRYQPIQKSSENVVSLIDWKYLLLIILVSLTLEWFLRKYYGKI